MLKSTAIPVRDLFHQWSGEHPGRATVAGTAVQVVKKIVEITQMQLLDKVVDIPVVMQRQVSMVQVVRQTLVMKKGRARA